MVNLIEIVQNKLNQMGPVLYLILKLNDERSTKTEFHLRCPFSYKCHLLQWYWTVLQRHCVSVREWKDMSGMGFGYKGEPFVIGCQIRETQLLQVSYSHSAHVL